MDFTEKISFLSTFLKENVLKSYPKPSQIEKAKLYCYQGNQFMMEKELEKAKKEYLSAIRTNPKNVEAHINLGIIFYHQFEPKEALKYFKSAHYLERQNVRALYWIARLNYEFGKYNKTEKLLRKTLQLNTEFVEANYYLGLTYLKKRNYRKAMVLFYKTLEFAPDWIDAYWQIGIVHYKLKDYKRSIIMLEKASETLKNNTDILLTLTKSYYCNNDIESAYSTIQTLREIDCNNIEANKLYAVIVKKINTRFTTNQSL